MINELFGFYIVARTDVKQTAAKPAEIGYMPTSLLRSLRISINGCISQAREARALEQPVPARLRSAQAK
jgi:hypothetical protein